MPFTVYVLRNPEGRLYIGQTDSLAYRLEQHNTGKSRWTANRGPWVLAQTEEFGTRAEAIRRGRALKGGRLNQELRERLSGGASGC